MYSDSVISFFARKTDRLNCMSAKDQPVFTVREILHRGALIQYVAHDNDDDWQFLPGYNVSASDMMIVTIVNIFKYDETIAAILDLEIGHRAFRRSIDDGWLITKIEE